jgi:hypothetical protein
VWSSVAALPQPTAAGMPSSRATIAVWDREAPTSVTMAARRGNSGVCQTGEQPVRDQWQATHLGGRRSPAGELQAVALGGGVRPGPPSRCRSDVARHGRAQLFGCPAGGRCLGGVTLCFPHVSDGLGQSGEAAKERRLGQGRVAGDGRGCGQQPGCPAQVVAGRGRTGNRAVGGTGGAVVGIGCLAEHPAAQRIGGVQRVGCGPGGVGSREIVKLLSEQPCLISRAG